MKGKILQAGKVIIPETTVSVRESSPGEWEGWFVIPAGVNIVPDSDYSIELDDNHAVYINVLSVSVAAPGKSQAYFKLQGDWTQ
jgi:hypothetical protein